MTPIFDQLVKAYAHSIEIAGLNASYFLEDWAHDRGEHWWG